MARAVGSSVTYPALFKYVLTSDNATCFIVPLSFVTILSASTKVVPVAHVVSAGSFSNTDGVGVSFTQSGTDGSMTSFTVAGTSGSSQTITNGNTLTIAAGANITTTGSSTDTVTIACTLDDPTALAIALG